MAPVGSRQKWGEGASRLLKPAGGALFPSQKKQQGRGRWVQLEELPAPPSRAGHRGVAVRAGVSGTGTARGVREGLSWPPKRGGGGGVQGGVSGARPLKSGGDRGDKDAPRTLESAQRGGQQPGGGSVAGGRAGRCSPPVPLAPGGSSGEGWTRAAGCDKARRPRGRSPLPSPTPPCTCRVPLCPTRLCVSFGARGEDGALGRVVGCVVLRVTDLCPWLPCQTGESPHSQAATGRLDGFVGFARPGTSRIAGLAGEVCAGAVSVCGEEAPAAALAGRGSVRRGSQQSRLLL